MRKRIGKAVAATAVCMFWCVGCTASEDTPTPDTAAEEEAAVSGDEVMPPPPVEETETAGMPEETDSGKMSETEEVPVEDSEDKNLFFYVSDDKVWENDLFRAFLEGEAVAYDRHQKEELTWPEYFKQDMEYRHGFLQGMQLAAEDLDGDGKEELMVMLDNYGESTDLYVFHEEEGRLYAWDKIENFYALQGGLVVLREGGIFNDVWANGSRGFADCAWRFNEDGGWEYIWYHCDCEEVEYFTGEDRAEYIRFKESLYLYEDGECVRELSKILQMLDGQDWSEAELVEGDEEFDEAYSALIDAPSEVIGRFSFPKWADNVVEIPIWEAPGGQGWVSVEDPPEYHREFEYVGE